MVTLKKETPHPTKTDNHRHCVNRCNYFSLSRDLTRTSDYMIM